MASAAAPIPIGDSDQHRGLIAALRSWWNGRKRGKSTTDYGSLVDVVSFSSRRIAARRALETEQRPPLFSDPLASKLAGTALKDARRASKRQDRRVSRIAVRTKWFDEEIEKALRGERGTVEVEVAPSSSDPSSVSVFIRPRSLPEPWPCQVVCLGCGMDTRPWRLAFPNSLKDSKGPSEEKSPSKNPTRWFDVDAGCVLRAKARELEEAGAEVPEGAFDLAFEGEEGEVEEEERRRRKEKSKKSKRKVKFPLKTSSYAAVPADVSKPGALAEALSRAGQDRSKPTVFVAEGLLMYLGTEGVATCLSAAAACCPSGSSCSSTFLAVTITPSALQSARARSQKRKAKGIDVATTDLLASWNFGCDARALPALLGSNGWSSQLDSVVSRSDMARRYGPLIGDRGFEYEIADARVSEERGSLFFVARK